MTDRALALAIFVLLAGIILLAVKSRFMNRCLFPLARQFRLHHLLSLGVLVLIIAHVVVAFWRDWPESASMYLNTTDLATLAGWAGAGLLATVIASSWISSLSWKRWYLVHLLSVPALFLSAYHGLSYASSRPVDTAVLVALLALIVVLLLQIFSERLGSQHSTAYQVLDNRAVAAGIFELHLVACGAATAALPAGSVVYLRFDSPGFSRAWHPFSVASSTRDKDVRLMIKAIGHDTGHVSGITAGSRVHIRGPFREFAPDLAREQVWIAGGIGVAPFIGYISGLGENPAQRIELFYFTGQPAETIGLSQYLRGKSTGLAMHTSVQKDRPDLAQLLALTHELPQAQYTICGPPAFMRYTRQALRSAGIAGNNIHTEEFQPW